MRRMGGATSVLMASYSKLLIDVQANYKLLC